MIKIPGESKKGPPFEKILLPENSSNDIENHLVLFPVSQLGSVIYPALIGHSLPSEWESSFRKLAKTSENTKQHFSLFSFLARMTLGCVHVFCALERMETPGPRNILFIQGGRLFSPTRGSTC